MKYIIGFMVAVVLFVGGLLVRPVLAEWVQPLAWEQVIAENPLTIYRTEWFNDVCYTTVNGSFGAVAISCVKK